MHLFAVLNCPEAAIGVISSRFVGPIVHYERVNFRYPRLSRSGEIQPKAVGCGTFGRSSNFDNCRPEVADDVISGAILDYVGVDVQARFGDSRLNSDQIIRIFV